MGVATGIAIYVVVWWVVLFAVLPWGVRPAEAPEPGTEPGAPARPRLLLKFGITSLVAAVVWLAIYAVAVSGLVSFRDWAVPL